MCGLAGLYAFKLSDDPEYADESTSDYLKYTAYALWGITGLIILVLLCCYSNLKLGIAVFSTSVDFTKSNCCVFILPTFGMIFTILWFVVWIISFTYVFSVGEVTQR